MKIVLFLKHILTRNVYYNGRHVFSREETPLENGIFALFGTRFHHEEPIFS
jgi:hypothetical protein